MATKLDTDFPFKDSPARLNPATLGTIAGLSGGLSRAPSDRGLEGATGASPNAPVANPAKAGNSGFERFLALHRGSRGGRVLTGKDKKHGAVYTEGKYKGMTEGEADIAAHKSFQKMGEGSRDNFRQVNEGDIAAARGRNIQAQRDEAALARENAGDTRREADAYEAKRTSGSQQGGVSNGNPYTPPAENTPSSAVLASAAPAAAPVVSPVKRPQPNLSSDPFERMAQEEALAATAAGTADPAATPVVNASVKKKQEEEKG